MKKFSVTKPMVYLTAIVFLAISGVCLLLSFLNNKSDFYDSSITNSEIYQQNKAIYDEIANNIISDENIIEYNASMGDTKSNDLLIKEKIVKSNGVLNLYAVAYRNDSYTISGQQTKAHFVYGISISYEKRFNQSGEQIRFTGLQMGMAAVYDGARPQYMDVNYGQYGIGDNWAMSEKNQSCLMFEKTFDKGWVYEVTGNFGITSDVYYLRGGLKSIRFQLNYR